MLVTLLIWILIFFESAVFGQTLYTRLIDPLTGDRPTKNLSPQKILLGFISLITISSYIALFFPLSNIIAISFLLLSLILFFKNKFTISFNKPNPITILLLTVALLFALETATRRPINPDTNLYHAQAIHWIEQFPAIHGLGNIHGRLAFNSIWFIANAFYSFEFLFGQSLHIVSGALFLFFTVLLIMGVTNRNSAPRRPAIIAILLFLAAFQYLAADISSAGSDTPAVLIIWLTLFFIHRSEEDHTDITSDQIVITALAAFAITIKLSTLVIVLLPLLMIAKNIYRKNYKEAILFFAIPAVILAPYFIRNVIQSGYLIYPLPALDFFNVWWKVPIERVIEEKNAILVWGRAPKLNIQEALAMPFWVWMPKWFMALSAGRKLIAITASLGPVFLVINRSIFKTRKQEILIHAIFIIGTYFWLFTTPDIRFGYGFLIPTIILNFLPMLGRFDRFALKNKIDLISIGKVVLLLYMTLVFARSFEVRTFTSRLLLPKDYDKVKTENCVVGTIPMSCSVEYNACSYHDFPCVPQQKDWVRSVSDDILDGFYGEK